jgi:signal transduction histidine kinase
VDALRSDTGDAVELQITGEPDRLDDAASEAVLRAAQEALTNVRKHAPGATVTVSLAIGPAGDLVLRVRDRPGVPDAVVPIAAGLAGTGGGYGLKGMHERAQALGGTVQAGPTGDGWQTELRLPGSAERQG